MRFLQFILSILLVACSFIMLAGAIVNASPIKMLSVIGMLIIFILCCVMSGIACRELLSKSK
nr:MAG TPA: hypothetical protein [Caudoviricetes sp.]